MIITVIGYDSAKISKTYKKINYISIVLQQNGEVAFSLGINQGLSQYDLALI